MVARRAARTKPVDVDEYIRSAPLNARAKLRAMRACIRGAAPGATEGLKWGMPGYSYSRILVTFAGFARHIGFYPTPSAIKAFAADLAPYKSAAGSVQFPLDRPLPLALIRLITAFRVRELVEEDKKWKG